MRSRMSALLSVVLFLLVSSNFCCGQECDSSGVKCMSCSKYQNCNGEVTGCKNGETCTDSILEQCKTKLNCYAGGECVGQGIFPDPSVEGNFYVCLGDAFTGFSKFEFSCQPGQYFDASSSTCIASEVTDPTATTSVMTTTPMETVSTESTPETTTTTTPLTTTTPVETPSSPLTTTTPVETPSSPLTTTTPVETPSSPLTTTTPVETPSSPLTTTTPVETPSSPLTTTTPVETPSSPLTTTTPTTPSVITTSETPGTTSPTASPDACIMPGIYPVLTNCKLYYRCSTSLKLFYFTCPGNSYFNEVILKCSLTISPSCQEQILKNTTSATPASTTSPITTPTTTEETTTTPVPTTSLATTQTTTTSPVPTTSLATTQTTTTSPVPTTVPTPPPITFVCPSVGTYENPTSCKTYFRCSSSGDIFIFTCPGASYFNEITKKCTLVLTPRCVNLIQL